MPIYDYRCRGCGHEFELIVLKGTVIACPSCQSQELEQQVSGFAVSSAEISRSNVKAARQQYIGSKDVRDKRISEVEHIREHDAHESPPPPKKK
jgi:putative FmdB family regulatory protein